MLTCLACLARHSKSHWRFQFLASIFDGFFEFRVSQACVHLVTARASLFTDQRMSGRPIRAMYKHLNTIWEQTSDTSPLYSNSSFLIW